MKSLLCLVAIAFLPYSYGHPNTFICTQIEEAIDLFKQQNVTLKNNGPLSMKVLNVPDKSNDIHCIETYSSGLQNLTKRFPALQQLSNSIIHLKRNIKKDNLPENKKCPTKVSNGLTFLNSLPGFLSIIGRECDTLR